MFHQKFNILLSHTVLAGTGIYCLIRIKNQSFIPPYVTYGLITVNNIAAVLCWEREINQTFLKMYRLTAYSQLLFVLPCITTTVWLQNGYSKEWSWTWVMVPIFPLLCYLVNADLDMPLADLLVMFNLVGLGAVSFVKEVNYGIVATIAYTISHYYMSRIVLYNYGLSFFSYFALKAIRLNNDTCS